ASFAVLMLVLYLTRLHPIAWVLLSVGAGSQIGRLIGRSRWRLGRQAVALGAVVAICGVSVRVWRARTEARALAARPVPPSGSPNVLLLILDTVAARHMSLYGYTHPTTPNLERWAREGVVFDRAFSTTSWTLPSHGSMFTGNYPWELSTDWMSPL